MGCQSRFLLGLRCLSPRYFPLIRSYNLLLSSNLGNQIDITIISVSATFPDCGFSTTPWRLGDSARHAYLRVRVGSGPRNLLVRYKHISSHTMFKAHLGHSAHPWSVILSTPDPVQRHCGILCMLVGLLAHDEALHAQIATVPTLSCDALFHKRALSGSGRRRDGCNEFAIGLAAHRMVVCCSISCLNVPSQLHFVRQGARGIDGACRHVPYATSSLTR